MRSARRIALSGDGKTLVVDAADEDGTVGGHQRRAIRGEQIGDNSNGALYVFVNTNGTWSQQAYIKSSNVRVNDLFGIRLASARNGNVLVASSMLQGGGGRGVTANQQDFSGEESGAVYVFTRTGTTWTQRAYLNRRTPMRTDEFGSGVAMSGDGNTLAVAAFGEDGGSAQASAATRPTTRCALPARCMSIEAGRRLSDDEFRGSQVLDGQPQRSKQRDLIVRRCPFRPFPAISLPSSPI